MERNLLVKPKGFTKSQLNFAYRTDLPHAPGQPSNRKVRLPRLCRPRHNWREAAAVAVPRSFNGLGSAPDQATSGSRTSQAPNRPAVIITALR